LFKENSILPVLKKYLPSSQTLGVSVDQQTETLPFEPDLDYTSVGKSR
jgi:hypothetical protein